MVPTWVTERSGQQQHSLILEQGGSWSSGIGTWWYETAWDEKMGEEVRRIPCTAPASLVLQRHPATTILSYVSRTIGTYQWSLPRHVLRLDPSAHDDPYHKDIRSVSWFFLESSAKRRITKYGISNRDQEDIVCNEILIGHNRSRNSPANFEQDKMAFIEKLQIYFIRFSTNRDGSKLDLIHFLSTSACAAILVTVRIERYMELVMHYLDHQQYDTFYEQKATITFYTCTLSTPHKSALDVHPVFWLNSHATSISWRHLGPHYVFKPP